MPRAILHLLSLALLATTFAEAAPTASAVLYAEDFESGTTGWAMPSWWGNTEGCLGAAEGARSLQIAKCGSPIPYVTALGTVHTLGGIEIPKPPSATDLTLDYAIRTTTDPLATAYLKIMANCPGVSTITLHTWRVGPDLPTELEESEPWTPAPTSWTHTSDSFTCPGSRMTLGLMLYFPHPSIPVDQLFGIDSIVVRGTQAPETRA